MKLSEVMMRRDHENLRGRTANFSGPAFPQLYFSEGGGGGGGGGSPGKKKVIPYNHS